MADIQSQALEVIVVAGTNLKNMAMVGTQGLFVELIYGGSKYLTNICKVRGSNAAFHDKFMIEHIQGFRHIKISVFNRNASSTDDFVGKGKISLHEVLQRGCQDTICHLKNKSLFAGEIRLIMMYPNAQVFQSAWSMLQSSYEEMKAAKEKAEEELNSYKNSAPGAAHLDHDKTSEVEMNIMRAKMAEKDEELAGLREELAAMKKELDAPNRTFQLEQVASQRLIVYELAMKQLHNELTDLKAQLI